MNQTNSPTHIFTSDGACFPAEILKGADMQTYRFPDIGYMNKSPIGPLIEKRWGHEQVLVDTGVYQVKRLLMKANQCCSMHYHERKHETITVIRGTLEIRFNELTCGKIRLLQGDCCELPAGKRFAHQMQAINESDCWYIESAISGCNDDAIRTEE